MTEVEAEWVEREKNFMREIDEEISRYWEYSTSTRWKARAASVISLFCYVLSPVTVITSASNLSVFGMSSQDLAKLSLVLSVLFAFVEGMRRIFGFDQRWVGAMMAMVAVKNQKERYLDSQIGKAIGSDEWKDALLSARAAVEAAAAGEMSDFFKNMLEAAKPRESEKL
jgi:hypothetical protein